MADVLVTGATGFLGAALLPRLQQEGHAVRAYARRPEAVAGGVPVVQGDAVEGTGLDEALEGIDVAYYLIHSMEGAGSSKSFDTLELRSVENFAAAAQRAGVRRTIYLGGLVPTDKAASRHLGSRLAVEETLLGGATPGGGRLPRLAGDRRPLALLPLPRAPGRARPAAPRSRRWAGNRTQPIDERDVVALLLAAATLGARSPARSRWTSRARTS